MKPKDPSSLQEVRSSSVLGAFLGTFAVALGNAFQSSKWAKILLYMSPTLAVFGDYVAGTIGSVVAVRRQKRALKDGKKTIEELLKNPHTSEKHKRDLRRQLESLEQQSVGSLYAKNPVLGGRQSNAKNVPSSGSKMVGQRSPKNPRDAT